MVAVCSGLHRYVSKHSFSDDGPFTAILYFLHHIPAGIRPIGGNGLVVERRGPLIDRDHAGEAGIPPKIRGGAKQRVVEIG